MMALPQPGSFGTEYRRMLEEAIRQQSPLQQQLLHQQLWNLRLQQPEIERPALNPVERADMQVCNLIAYRVWRITPAGYLMSTAVDQIWFPGEPMEGEVGDHNGKGVHAYKQRNHALMHTVTSSCMATGSVLLWGEVVEHERGYRAERAKIVSIDDVCWNNEPPWSETVQRALAFLRERYALNQH